MHIYVAVLWIVTCRKACSRRCAYMICVFVAAQFTANVAFAPIYEKYAEHISSTTSPIGASVRKWFGCNGPAKPQYIIW